MGKFKSQEQTDVFYVSVALNAPYSVAPAKSITLKELISEFCAFRIIVSPSLSL